MPDVRVSQDAAYRLDRHALRQGERGEGVSADMERHSGPDAAFFSQRDQVLVAAVVARNFENGVPGGISMLL